jgi:stringent starvation protein B
VSGVRLSRRPYLLRAMHQWMTDSALTPQVLVDATVTGADVPKAFVRDGRIVLNIGYDATRNLDLGNDWVTFQARFGGVPRSVRFPLTAIHSIYARETGEGLVFPPEGEGPPALGESVPLPSSSASSTLQSDAGAPEPDPPPPRRPTLKVVK